MPGSGLVPNSIGMATKALWNRLFVTMAGCGPVRSWRVPSPSTRTFSPFSMVVMTCSTTATTSHGFRMLAMASFCPCASTRSKSSRSGMDTVPIFWCRIHTMCIPFSRASHRHASTISSTSVTSTSRAFP